MEGDRPASGDVLIVPDKVTGRGYTLSTRQAAPRNSGMPPTSWLCGKPSSGRRHQAYPSGARTATRASSG